MFTSVDINNNGTIYNSIDWFFYDDKSLTMAYMSYEKVDTLGLKALIFLKNMGLKNRRNYINEYLNIRVCFGIITC